MKKFRTPRHFSIPVQIYGVILHVSIMEKDEDVKRRWGSDLLDCEGHQACTQTSLDKKEMLVRIHPKCEDVVSTAVHELFHVTSIILRTRGARLSEESEEAYAYLLTYLFEEFMKQVQRYK